MWEHVDDDSVGRSHVFVLLNAASHGGGWVRAADSLESWRRPPSGGQSQPYPSGNVQQSYSVSHLRPCSFEWMLSGNTLIPSYQAR